MPADATPDLTIHLDRAPQRFDDESAGFRPLGLPDAIRLELGTLSADLLAEAHLDLAVELSSGRYDLPFSGGEPCHFEVPRDCRAEAIITIGLGEGGIPIVQALDVEFSRPVIFHNILSTLTEVHTLFEDRVATFVRDKLDDLIDTTLAGTFVGGALKTAIHALDEGAGGLPMELLRRVLQITGERLDVLGDIHLAGFSAAPESRRSGGEQLRFRFRGHALISDRLRVPFRDVKLLSLVLPTLHASVESLLSDNPLASAELYADRIPHASLVRRVRTMVGSFSASVSARGHLPVTRLATETFTRTKMSATAITPSACAVSGVVVGALNEGRIDLRTEGFELSLGEDRLTVDVHADVDIEEALDIALEALEATIHDRPAPRMRVELAALHIDRELGKTGRLELHIHEGSTLGALRAGIRLEHPLAIGRTDVTVGLSGVALSGGCVATFDGPGRRVILSSLNFALEGELEGEPDGTLADGVSEWTPEALSGHFAATVVCGAERQLTATINATADLSIHGDVRIDPIPEIRVDDEHIAVQARATTTLDARVRILHRDDGLPVVDFEGSKAVITLRKADVRAGDVRLVVPKGTVVTTAFTRAFLAANGLGESEVALSWDMKGRSPVLSVEDQAVEVFVDELRAMDVIAHISSAGRLTFSGGEGLYDGAFVNALLNPLEEQAKWLDILANDEATDRVLQTVTLVAPDVEDLAQQLRLALGRVREVFDDEGVVTPADMIPRHNMARVFSRILAGDTRLVDRLTAIIKQVTDADGLDRHALEAIVQELWPDHPYQFELDRGLRWLDHVLSPGKPLPPPVVREHISPVDDLRFASLLQKLPSAGELYAMVEGDEPIRRDQAKRVAHLCSWLSAGQIGYLLEKGGERWPAFARHRMRYVAELKHRIAMISKGYGGVGYTPQATAIAFFLADVIDADGDEGGISGMPEAFPPSGILGPKDIAILLQAGLANVSHGRTVQLNQRMLFDYARRRAPLFFLGVLAEMGIRSPRVLAGVLWAFLNQDQQHMREPFDMPATLSELLGIKIPRREDYMAGGRWAKESYYQAVMRTSEFILKEADPYMAVKLHLRSHRHEVPEPPKERRRLTRREKDAQQAIKYADKVAAKCTFGLESGGPLDNAREAYEMAFAACAELIRWEPVAFQRDWLKGFWQRNHEALMVRSVVRNVQDGVDRVREWLEVRSKRPVSDNEQELLEAVVEALYHFPEDQAVILQDPLVRLLLDPPEGRYDFTIVSGMGVVTEGRHGRELEDAFTRLEASRGVRLVRADTATAETLRHNADKVIEAVREVEGAYGLIGYSQGCANVLMAESILRSGTPEMQLLLEDLRCRNFLFSAINGSAHGSCGNDKFLRAMVEGEAFLKFYQGIFSAAVIQAFQKVIYAVMESPHVTHIVGSVDSLSHEGVVGLTRDGQFKGDVPTSTVRGVVTEEITPEALDFLSNVITRQVQGALHDTQVTLVSAVGYPDRVSTPAGDVLKRCDVGSYAQTTHHWSPLLYASEFVTTERDKERCIYDFPKDRHIFPWVEVNARFGLIDVLPGGNQQSLLLPE